MSGINEDGLECYSEGTITYRCLNPFCGYTFAESTEELIFRHPAVRDIHICPMCHGEGAKMVHFEPPPMRLVGTKSGRSEDS
jgi:hypothetical protein